MTNLFALLALLAATSAMAADRPVLWNAHARQAVKEFDAEVQKLVKNHTSRVETLDEELDKEVAKRRDLLCEEIVRLRKESGAKDNAKDAFQLDQAHDFYKKYDPIRADASGRDAKSQAVVYELRRQLRELKRSGPRAADIPKEAVEYEGHRYLRVDEPATKHVALRRAESLGGHLARIENASEQRFVQSLLAQVPYGGGYNIDGSDEKTEGSWVWSNGQRAAYLDWTKGQPDGGDHGRGDAHGIRIGKTGGMSDGRCNVRKPYVIEWGAVNKQPSNDAGRFPRSDVVGTWEFYWDNPPGMKKNTQRLQFDKDGVVSVITKPEHAKGDWEIDEKTSRILVRWRGKRGGWESLNLPIASGKATGDSWAGPGIIAAKKLN